MQAYAFRILSTGDGRRQADFAKDTEVVGTRVFIPASHILILVLAFSRCELVVLLTVVWNMVVKPVGSPGWFWGAIVVMAVVIVAVVAGYLRGERALVVATD